MVLNVKSFVIIIFLYLKAGIRRYSEPLCGEYGIVYLIYCRNIIKSIVSTCENLIVFAIL